MQGVRIVGMSIGASVLYGILHDQITTRSGSWPPLTPRDLVRPIGCLLLAMALCAAITGIWGYFTGLHHPDQIVLDLDRRDWAPVASPEKWPFFLADYCAHNTSYDVGYIGGVVVIALTLRRRAQLAQRSLE